MLSCLPDSAHSQRVMGWMQSMLQQDDKGQWIVEPPEEGLKEWERDGITLKPDAYFRGGKKAWLLEQMVQLTPVSFWTRALGLTPLEVMEWSRRSDWKSSLRQGWVRALQYQLDVEWIDAAQALGRDMRHDALLPALMARLSPKNASPAGLPSSSATGTSSSTPSRACPSRWAVPNCSRPRCRRG